MAKVSTTHLKINGRTRTAEIHYSTKESEFHVRLPDIENMVGRRALGETEKAAIAAAQQLIGEYEKMKSNKRKVLLIYFPTEDAFRRFSYGGLQIESVQIQFAYNVAEEIEMDGEKRFITAEGRSIAHSLQNFLSIPWTQEREDFFRCMHERMQQAKENIRTFLQECENRPKLVDEAAAGKVALLTDGTSLV